LPDTETIFAEYNHGQLHARSLAIDANDRGLIIRHRGECVGVEAHSQSSGSIFSNSLLMIRLIRSLCVEVFQTTSKPHPELFFSFQASLELLLDSLGYKGAQRDASLGGHRFGAAKDGVGNLKSGLHPLKLPCLWDTVNRRSQGTHETTNPPTVAFHNSLDDGNASITPG
jgi:hypothetical protein